MLDRIRLVTRVVGYVGYRCRSHRPLVGCSAVLPASTPGAAAAGYTTLRAGGCGRTRARHGRGANNQSFNPRLYTPCTVTSRTLALNVGCSP